MLLSIDRCGSVFFPIWYREHVKVSMAYGISSIVAMNVFVATYLPVWIGSIELPHMSQSGSSCVVLHRTSESSRTSTNVIWGLYLTVVPLIGNCVMTAAVYIRRRRTSSTSRKFQFFSPCFLEFLLTIQDENE